MPDIGLSKCSRPLCLMSPYSTLLWQMLYFHLTTWSSIWPTSAIPKMPLCYFDGPYVISSLTVMVYLLSVLRTTWMTYLSASLICNCDWNMFNLCPFPTSWWLFLGSPYISIFLLIYLCALLSFLCLVCSPKFLNCTLGLAGYNGCTKLYCLPMYI